MILAILRLKSSSVRTTELVQGLRLLLRSARAEKGFVSSRLSSDLDDCDVVQYEERWSSRQDLEDQVRSSRYTRLLALMESASEQPTLEFHFVSETRGLDFVAAVRGAD